MEITELLEKLHSFAEDVPMELHMNLDKTSRFCTFLFDLHTKATILIDDFEELGKRLDKLTGERKELVHACKVAKALYREKCDEIKALKADVVKEIRTKLLFYIEVYMDDGTVTDELKRELDHICKEVSDCVN